MEEKNNGIGLIACIAIIAGGMIGSAIFSLSGLTMYQAGPAAILSWILAAIIMLIYGLICSELSTVFPKSGGVYVFPSKAFNNKFLGWISTWGYINGNILAVAFAAIYVATYLSAGFNISANLQVILAVASIVFCLILNCINFKVVGKLNSILVTGLLTSMAIYIVVSVSSASWNVSNFRPFFTQGASGQFGFMRAVPTAMLAYGSIVAVAFMVSEVKNAEKNVPLAVFIAMTIVTVFYVLIIVSTLGLISASFLSENPGMTYIPLYAVCFTRLSSVTWLAKVVSVAAILALVTTMLVVLALTARALQAAALDGIVPKILAKNNKYGVPAFATVAVALPAIVISCFPSFTEVIVNFGALFGAVTIVINIFSLFKVRRSALESSFKAPGGNFLPAVALILIVVCYIPDILSGYEIWVYTIAWYALGSLIYKVGK